MLREKGKRIDYELSPLRKDAKDKIVEWAETNRVTVSSAIECAIYLFLDVCPDQIETIMKYDAQKAAKQLKKHMGVLRKIKYLQTKRG